MEDFVVPPERWSMAKLKEACRDYGLLIKDRVYAKSELVVLLRTSQVVPKLIVNPCLVANGEDGPWYHIDIFQEGRYVNVRLDSTKRCCETFGLRYMVPKNFENIRKKGELIGYSLVEKATRKLILSLREGDYQIVRCGLDELEDPGVFEEALVSKEKQGDYVLVKVKTTEGVVYVVAYVFQEADYYDHTLVVESSFAHPVEVNI